MNDRQGQVRVRALLLALVLLLAQAAAAQSANRAALIVRFGDGRVETRCVAFDEDRISGHELLERSGLELQVRYEGAGAAVCAIEADGCPPGDCFCRCSGGEDCVYWSYWHQQDGEWQYAVLGATSYQVMDGQVDGWSWGPGSVTQAISPPPVSFEDVCGDDQAIVNPPAPAEADDPLDGSAFFGLGVVAVALAAGFVIVAQRRRSAEP